MDQETNPHRLSRRYPKRVFALKGLDILAQGNALGTEEEAARKAAEGAAAQGLLDEVTIAVVEELEVELTP